jgi:hypothetical protein
VTDIFISYSKSDRDLASRLSSFLEAEGWTVWWDKSLEPADKFRDVIIKELALARAVITIWTPNSVTSDWVRAEAGRAKADGKLIPVKSSAVTYKDIPLQFGEMHTEDVTATKLIRAAVVAQLAKPVVAQSAARSTLCAINCSPGPASSAAPLRCSQISTVSFEWQIGRELSSRIGMNGPTQYGRGCFRVSESNCHRLLRRHFRSSLL